MKEERIYKERIIKQERKEIREIYIVSEWEKGMLFNDMYF